MVKIVFAQSAVTLSSSYCLKIAVASIAAFLHHSNVSDKLFAKFALVSILLLALLFDLIQKTLELLLV